MIAGEYRQCRVPPIREVVANRPLVRARRLGIKWAAELSSSQEGRNERKSKVHVANPRVPKLERRGAKAPAAMTRGVSLRPQADTSKKVAPVSGPRYAVSPRRHAPPRHFTRPAGRKNAHEEEAPQR